MNASIKNRTWQKTLRQRLPYLGHRNWIVITDAAYPQQTSPGIETILAGGRVAPTVAAVLDVVRDSKHVRPVVYLDAELAVLPSEYAEGIDAVRNQLAVATTGLPVHRLPHEEIIAKLDAAGRSFNILLIKTQEMLPYTSVFIELDCGYWSPEGEKALRAAMKKPRNRK